MRILLDTNILVRANRASLGSARTLLDTLIEQGHTLLLSREMLFELATVLRYPRIQARFGLKEEEIYEYILFLQQVSKIVTVDPLLGVPIRDPRDLVVLQTAVAGEADVICTVDSDFHAPATKTFCAILGIEICGDVELLARLNRERK